MKLEALEKRVAVLLDKIPTPLSFEEFKAKWEIMGELDKSIYVSMAECPELFGVDPTGDERLTAIFHHLEDMGLVKEHIRLQDLIKEMEN